MEDLFITPMTGIQGMAGIGGVGENAQKISGEKGVSLFQGIFQDMIGDVRELEDNYEKQKYLLATGQIDDPHTVPIAGAELQLSVDMLIQLRNKALEAYNSLITMSM